MGLGSAVLVSVERDWVSSDQRHVCKPSLWSPHACYDSDVLTSHKWSTNNYYNNDNNKIQLGKINFTNVSEAEKLSENWQRISPWGCDWRTGARCWFHANITLFLGSYQNAHKAVRACPYENNHFLGAPTRPVLWASTIRLHDLTRVLERKKIHWSGKWKIIFKWLTECL